MDPNKGTSHLSCALGKVATGALQSAMLLQRKPVGYYRMPSFDIERTSSCHKGPMHTGFREAYDDTRLLHIEISRRTRCHPFNVDHLTTVGYVDTVEVPTVRHWRCS
jgi:hypothetical protein